jgi:ATP-dependent 26S proteasome regulatory subunit
MEQLSSPYFMHFLLQNLNIQNSIYSVLLILFIPPLIQKFTEDININTDLFYNFSFKYIFNWFKKYKGFIKLKGSIVQVQKFNNNIHYNFSTSMKSILWYIQKLLSENKININKLEEFNINDDKMYNKHTDEYEHDGEFTWITCNNTEFILDNDIFCKIIKNTTFKGENPTVKTTYLNIHIYSYKYSYNYLLNYIQNIEKQYNNEDIRYQNNDSNLYLITNCNQDEEDGTISFNKLIFNSVKKFNNIFFKDKSKFINDVDFFINNYEWYKNKGIPYTFGIFLYGKPGTGKTSLIKALANYTNRHILNINLKSIKTATQFTEIFQTKNFGKTVIPSNKIIIIIEDIDCLTDIIANRSKNELNKPTKPNKNDNDKNNKNNNEITLINKDDNDKLTLSHILNTIDGCYERNGNILIITTNHPEKIDPALIRPGRIDWSLNLDYLSKEMFNEMFCYFYSLTKKCFNKLRKIIFLEYKLSPAFFQNILKLNKNNINNCIDEINEKIYKNNIIEHLNRLNNPDNISIEVNVEYLQKIYFDFLLQKNSYDIKLILEDINHS